jgi:peroxiredoxin
MVIRLARLGISTVCVLILLLTTGLAQADLTFFGWSDQHVKTDGNGDHLAPAIEAMNSLAGKRYPDAIGGLVDAPAFVLGLGDITEWPTVAARDTYHRLITRSLRYPSYDVPGNHDSGGLEPSEVINDWLKARHGALSYSFDAGGVHFVMLSFSYDEKLGTPKQPVPKETLDYLRSDLERQPKTKPVVVGIHLSFESITNPDDFIGAFGDWNVILVLGGHFHHATVNLYHGVNFVQLPSPAPGSPDAVTAIRISAERLVAVPYEYRTGQWTIDAKQILDVPIHGPKDQPKADTIIDSKAVKTLSIGSPAPDFSLPGIDGRVWSLRDFCDAKVLAVVFTCNHCPTAQAYEGRIQAIAKDYRDKGVAVCAISPNDPKAVRLDELGYTDLSDSYAEMKSRAARLKIDYPYLYDGEHQSVSAAYGPSTTPHVFVFDRARKLRFVGRIDDNEDPRKVTVSDTRNAIDALLADKPVGVETTKTFGCSIKWSDKRSGVQQAIDKWAAEPIEIKSIGISEVKELLKNQTEKYRLINFWASWCGPCVAEFDDLVAIHRSYRNRNFELITISLDDPSNSKAVIEFLKKQQASFANYHFSEANKYPLIDAVGGNWSGGIPFTVLVAPGGKNITTSEGSIDAAAMRTLIVDQLGRYYFKP